MRGFLLLRKKRPGQNKVWSIYRPCNTSIAQSLRTITHRRSTVAGSRSRRAACTRALSQSLLSLLPPATIREPFPNPNRRIDTCLQHDTLSQPHHTLVCAAAADSSASSPGSAKLRLLLIGVCDSCVAGSKPNGPWLCRHDARSYRANRRSGRGLRLHDATRTMHDATRTMHDATRTMHDATREMVRVVIFEFISAACVAV